MKRIVIQTIAMYVKFPEDVDIFDVCSVESFGYLWPRAWDDSLSAFMWTCHLSVRIATQRYGTVVL